MFVVPRDPKSHDLEWSKVFEVSSLKEWVDERNKKTEEMKINHRYWALSEFTAEYCDGGGRILKSYHACEKNPFRLI